MIDIKAKVEELLPLHEAKTTFKCKDNQHSECFGIVQGEDAGSWSMCVCNCHYRYVIVEFCLELLKTNLKEHG